ncbi:ATP-binding protein [Methanocorpusculum labreanum]|nr:ATP-binding protein [Methanocorpusculum labreanum]
MTPQIYSDTQLVMNGKIYNSEENCYGNGWNWDAGSRVLSLNSYHGSGIDCYGDISIIASGAENTIIGKHRPGIRVRNGGLTISGEGSLILSESETGICVDFGTLSITSVYVGITGVACGIHAKKGIAISGSTISILSKDTGIRSGAGITADTSSLKIIAAGTGIECFGGLELDGGTHLIEAPDGMGIHVRDGSCTLKNCFLRAASRKIGIISEKGDLHLSSVTAEIGAGTGISVGGSLIGTDLHLFINGEDAGILVEGEICRLFDGSCAVFGNSALSFSHDAVFTQMNVTVEGEITGILIGAGFCLEDSSVSVISGKEIGVRVGTDMHFSGRSLEIRGRTGLVVNGNLEVSNGTLTSINEGTGIDVKGTYIQNSGMICGTGMAGDGICVAKKMTVYGGKIEATGYTTGLYVHDDLRLTSGLLTASGKTGLKIDGSIEDLGGYLTVFGDEFGLYVSNGAASFNDAVVDIAGDVALYAGNTVNISGGAVQISGRYAGIFSCSGDIQIHSGMHDISADIYGILITSGSIYAKGGSLQIRATDIEENSSGICLGSGDLIVSGTHLDIVGGMYGVKGEQSTVTVANSGLDAEGAIYGIAVKRLSFTGCNLTAYGKKAALSLEDATTLGEKDTIVTCGKSMGGAEPCPYTDQKYVHLYPRHFARLIIPATVESLEQIVEWVDTALRPNGVAEPFISKMTLVIEELFVNIVNYAYPNETGSVTFMMHIGPCLKLIITDLGVPFNPLEYAEPDVTLPIDDRNVGGWGIFLSRKLTDRITYERVNGTNVLTVYKKIYS